MKYNIEEMKASDWEQVKNIYIEGIKTGIATFQTEAPTWENWNIGHLDKCRLVARSVNGILGWVALSPTSSRDCYKGVVEVSIYVGEKYKGQGIGKNLLTSLINNSEENGIWTLYCAIIRENIASIAMHKSCGFREIGIREKVARTSSGVWHDVVLMERRSKKVGIN
ncbi:MULTISPECIES: GNAT family N-acetyltransferase [unclassified Clostridium]|uniref:GNAT family N-acetyltransferase n=1 Tax=unclassified Clostridium TaxID=2614128 RepID=UPI0002981F0C|nr:MULTISPECIES: GNAT family N-acetyltransferase [unclassified Clostridium]EKQ56057.1 MAG: sortase-like acyltransferase [Clostridium sp. Maddingley MBC34-26]